MFAEKQSDRLEYSFMRRLKQTLSGKLAWVPYFTDTNSIYDKRFEIFISWSKPNSWDG